MKRVQANLIWRMIGQANSYISFESALFRIDVLYAQFFIPSNGVRYMEGRFDFSPDYPY